MIEQREMVLKALPEIEQYFNDCASRAQIGSNRYIKLSAMAKAAELAKRMLEPKQAQKIIVRNRDGSVTHWFTCPECYTKIDNHDRFCRRCGEAVKWDDGGEDQGDRGAEKPD